MEYQSIESEKKRKDLVRSETLTIFVKKKISRQTGLNIGILLPIRHLTVRLRLLSFIIKEKYDICIFL